MRLTSQEQALLLQTARESLESFFDLRTSPTQIQSTPTLRQPFPCFVTLMTKNKKLRGCIGCLETNNELIKNVYKYARHAAVKDPRFSPVTAPEIKNLKIGISVLGPSFPLKSLDDLVLGTHGLCVEYRNNKGVLLAKVATEQEWDKDTFLEETCIKAGLDPKNKNQYSVFYFEEISFEES